jgi:Protein of unknown function (DUF4089)
MDSLLTPTDTLTYLREAARLAGLQLDDDQLTRVAEQFVPSARMAAALLDFQLPPGLDPLPLPALSIRADHD